MTDAREFYLKETNNTFVLPASIDIPILLEPGQVVSVDITNELPEGSDIVNLLQNEQAPQQYWLNFAHAFVAKSQYQDAEEVLTAAVKSAQFSLDAVAFHVFLAWLNLRRGGAETDAVERGRFLRLAQDSLHVHGDSSLLVLTRATVMLSAAQHDHALELFALVLQQQPTNTVALTGRAHILLHRGQYGAALKLYQQVLILNPLMVPDSRIGIGLCFWFLGDGKMARKAWTRSLAICGTAAAGATPSAGELAARLLLNLADFDALFTTSLTDADFLTSYHDALAVLKATHAAAPHNPTALLMLAAHFYALQNLAEVTRLCDIVVQRLKPDAAQPQAHAAPLSMAHFFLARVAFANGDFTMAQKHFHDSIRLHELAGAKLGLAQAQIARGNTDEAVLTLESASKQSGPVHKLSTSSEIIYALGVLYATKSLAAPSVDLRIKAVGQLERYVRLTSSSDPVILNAYLLLSQLHEHTDVNKALAYLQKAVAVVKKQRREIPVPMMNNCGVFEFAKGNVGNAREFFALARSQNENEASGVTLDYNYARVTENDGDGGYDALLERCPGYLDARLRVLFHAALAANTPEALRALYETLQGLVQAHEESASLRSMYGWFLHNHGKTLGLAPDLESAHHKRTLTSVDSHDTYALLCLANLYYRIAKDLRGAKDNVKRTLYFVRAAQLFQKVLKVDRLNVFAAQGMAILLIEFQHTAMGLEIFRKVRDSLNDLSIFLNMGHTYLQLKQFAKAIDCYELGLTRFAAKNDPRILSFLGKAWLLRGVAEKSTGCLLEALKHAERAYQLSPLAALKFNIAYVQFQIASFLLTVPPLGRTVKELEDASVGLEDAIQIMAALALGENPPYPADELQARANMGENTTRKQLAEAIADQQAFVLTAEQKLAEGLRQKESEQARLQAERDQQREREEKLQAQMAAERAKLAEQASEWVREMASYVDATGSDDEANAKKEEKEEKKKKRAKKFIDDSDVDASDAEPEPKKAKRRREKAKSGKTLSNAVIHDSDEELAVDPAPGPEDHVDEE